MKLFRMESVALTGCELLLTIPISPSPSTFCGPGPGTSSSRTRGLDAAGAEEEDPMLPVGKDASGKAVSSASIVDGREDMAGWLEEGKEDGNEVES